MIPSRETSIALDRSWTQLESRDPEGLDPDVTVHRGSCGNMKIVEFRTGRHCLVEIRKDTLSELLQVTPGHGLGKTELKRASRIVSLCASMGAGSAPAMSRVGRFRDEPFSIGIPTPCGAI